MRKILLIVFVLSTWACTQKPGYVINLKIAGSQGTAFLSQRIKGDWVNLDSAVIEDGACHFSGTVKNPEVYYLGLSSVNDKLPFFIENSEISITGVVDSLTSAKVSGGSVQNEFQTLQDKLDKLDAEAMVFYYASKKFSKDGQQFKADSLMNEAETIFESIDNIQKDYIQANPASFVSPYLLGRVYYDMEADVLDGILSGFDPKFDSISVVLSLKDRVAKLKLVAVGQIAPDFTMNDSDGIPVKLSDVYSKNDYTLVDFWASWCGPCRRENPNVVSVFSKYKTKGFGVFGVSLDTDKEKWLKAVSDDQLLWPHVSDLKGWKNEAAALYSVNSIPANLLINRSGKIVGRNLREEKLQETISGLIN
ncbi:MAG: TlpA disulfide reductase family protein [Prolixibacteraceae bacterium]